MLLCFFIEASCNPKLSKRKKPTTERKQWKGIKINAHCVRTQCVCVLTKCTHTQWQWRSGRFPLFAAMRSTLGNKTLGKTIIFHWLICRVFCLPPSRFNRWKLNQGNNCIRDTLAFVRRHRYRYADSFDILIIAQPMRFIYFQLRWHLRHSLVSVICFLCRALKSTPSKSIRYFKFSAIIYLSPRQTIRFTWCASIGPLFE